MTEYVVEMYCEPSSVKCEEVVRCKDCAKWSYFDDDDGLRYGECAEFTAKVDIGCGHATRETGFCAWGVKRES